MAIHQLFDAHWKLKLKVRVKIVDECFSRWPQLLEHTPHYEFGCGAGQMAAALAHRGIQVQCWDHDELYKPWILALNLEWCEPRSAQPEVCWMGSVLCSVDQCENATAWLTNQCSSIPSKWWIFRETLNLYRDLTFPSTLLTPGWARTREIVDACPPLHRVDEFECECVETDGTLVTHRVVLCKTICD